MSRFNTGNPLGSGSPLDLDDNAKNLDVLTNSTEALSNPDRFGVQRKTWYGMGRDHENAQSARAIDFDNFLHASGYQDLGEYAPGIEITAHNQYVTFGGQPYLLKPSIPVPYTTSGAWTGDDFKLIGDGSLRQDLANPDKGAAMVARGVVAVDSIADLLALPEGQRKAGLRFSVASFYEGKNQGGGTFVWDTNKDKADADGGLVIDPDSAGDLGALPEQARLNSYSTNQGEGSGNGCFVRIDSGDLSGECWGVADGLEVSRSLNKMFLATRGGDRKIIVHSNGIRVDSIVTCYGTSCEFKGVVQFKSYSGYFKVVSITEVQPSYQLDLNKVTDIPEMTYKIDFLSDVSIGSYVSITTTEKINRFNAGNWQHYYKNLPVKIVGSDGKVSCRFPWSVEKENITSVEVFEPEELIHVHFAHIVVDNDTDRGSSPYYHVITIGRDSVDVKVGNIEAIHPSNRVTGTISVLSNNVTVRDSKLLTVGSTGDLYAIQFSNCVDLKVVNCTMLSGNGRAVAGRHGSNMHVLDCDFIGRVDDHMGSGMVVRNTKCEKVSFAGSDVEIKGVTTYTYQLLAIRSDTPILRGNVVLENSRVLNLLDQNAHKSAIDMDVLAPMDGFGYPPCFGDYIRIVDIQFPDGVYQTVNPGVKVIKLLTYSPNFVSGGGYVMKPRVIDISGIHGTDSEKPVIGVESAVLFTHSEGGPIKVFISRCSEITVQFIGLTANTGADADLWMNATDSIGAITLFVSDCDLRIFAIDSGTIDECLISNSRITTGIGSGYGSTVRGKLGSGIVVFNNCYFSPSVSVSNRQDLFELVNCRIADFAPYKPYEARITRSVGTVVDKNSTETPTIDLLQHVSSGVYQVTLGE